MRPKKQILLVGSDEDRLSLLAFMLETNGFATARAFCSADALAQVHERRRELLVIDLPFEAAQPVLDAGRAIDPSMHSMILRGERDVWEGRADAVTSRNISGEEMLLRVKLLSGRKRGPRPYCIPPIGVQIEEMIAQRRRA
jgi:DNA-binding response OmpR family regulator